MAKDTPGRVGRGEQGEARAGTSTPRGGPHREQARLRLKIWFKQHFSGAATTPHHRTCVYVKGVVLQPYSGHVQTKAKSQIVNRNENKQGADWCLVQTCSPPIFRFRKNTRSKTHFAKIKKLSAEKRKTKANRKYEQQHFSVSFWSAQLRQNISGLPYTAHNPPPAQQQAAKIPRK